MCRQVKFLFVLIVLVLLPITALAGSHSLTRYVHDDVSGKGFFDLVVSLDWVPSDSDKSGLLKTAFEQFAKDTYEMSEGNQKIRHLYVYTDNEHMNNADIRILDKSGRSNAHVNGIFDNGGRMIVYTKNANRDQRSGVQIGHTIAHEFGHYAYGLYDEYQGHYSSSIYPGVPLSEDVPKQTVMSNQEAYQWFSIDSDYTDIKERNTAQWRVHRSSAWKTLVRSPRNDLVNEHFIAFFPRIRYDEFNNMLTPTLLSLPLTGWDSNFEIVYMGESLAVLLIDNSLSMDDGTPPAIDEAKNAAKQFVDMMESGDKVAVVTFNDTATTALGITELDSQATRDSVKAVIDALDTGGSDTFFNPALKETMSVLNSASATTGTMLQTRYVIMLTDSVRLHDTYDLQEYIDKSIPIFTIGLNKEGEDKLIDIADQTGGLYNFSPSPLDLANLYAGINRDILGRLVLLKKKSAQLSQGGVSEMSTIFSGQEENLTFRAGWESGDVMRLELRTPDGASITPSALPAGVSYTSGDSHCFYTIENPQQGTWKSIVTAETVSAGGTVSQEAMAGSVLSAKLQLLGGRYPEPISILATINGPESVVGSTVAASVEGPTGEKIPLVLKDDGSPPDAKADDGIYSGVLVDYTMNGDYKVTLTVTNPSGTAAKDTSGALESGTDMPAEILPPFERLAEETITTSAYRAQPNQYTEAIEIPLDNTKVWGTIENDGDVVWYKINPKKGTKYFIQTSNLISKDATNMATLMTLYDPDASTEIGSNAHYDGSDISRITWTAPKSDTYYISIQHASPGTGTYAVSGGPDNIYNGDNTEAANVVSPVSETTASDGGGGGGCFIATAAYGSPLHGHIGILRSFRDHILLKNSIGKSVVAFYYTHSPVAAQYIEKHQTAKTLVKLSLLPLVGLSWAALKIGMFNVVILLLSFVLGLYWMSVNMNLKWRSSRKG